MADGLLTSILGVIDRQKQATKAGLGLLVNDPMEFARSATARYFPTPEEVAQQRAMEQSGNMAMNTPYMDKMFNLAQFAAPTVYHGTAHLFQPTAKNLLGEFNPTKIGTGEGNQMYAYGHYLGGAKETGQKYQKDISSDYFSTPSGELFSPRNLQHLNVKVLANRNQIDEAIAKAKEISSGTSPSAGLAKQDLQLLQQMKQKGGLQPHQGYLYTVDLPDSSVRRMLDYDKELKDQPKRIRNLATKYGVDLNDIGFDLIQKIGNNAKGSEIMRNAGIPGVKYLDEGSRGNFKAQTTYKGQPYGDVISFKTKGQLDDYIAEKGKEGFGVKTFPQTSNYVVFPKNEGLLTIKSRNQ
jgi:hypothetical protein